MVRGGGVSRDWKKPASASHGARLPRYPERRMKTLRIRSNISLREAVTRALSSVSRTWRGDAVVTTTASTVTVQSDLLAGEVSLHVVQDATGTSVFHGDALALRIEGEVLLVDERTVTPLRRAFWRPQ